MNPKDIKVGDVKHLPSTRPEGAKAKSVMTLEATVDTTPQELTKLASFEAMLLRVPGELSQQGQTTFKSLCDCFDKAKNMQEGKLKDILWGFEQSGHHPALSLEGIKNLKENGYVNVQAPDGTYALDFSAKHILEYWVRYTTKFRKLVYQL